ncbi:transglycosylase domain-containing protein [Pannonibacter sp. Pt2-lr]
MERKIKEAFLAFWLEANLSKREILKLYLDRAYMGGGVFGVTAASEFYFRKNVRELTLAEAAMLAGLYKAPTKYAPHINLPAARARANEVLSNMVQAGFMTEGQVIGARRNPAVAVDRSQDQAPDFYLDWAFNEVKRLARRHPALARDRIVTVRTTLDPALQREAEQSVDAIMRQFSEERRAREAAIVALVPDGAVRAMVGGRDYGASQFNRAVDALRQPGSSSSLSST